MASSPQPTRSLKPRVVRIELNLQGEEHVLEQNLDMLNARTLSHRRGETMVWDFGSARVIADEDGAEVLLTNSLAVMSDERQWRIVEHILEDLERKGFVLRKRR